MCRLWEDGRRKWKASGCLWWVANCPLSCNNKEDGNQTWFVTKSFRSQATCVFAIWNLCHQGWFTLFPQPGKYAGIAGMIDILQGLGVRSKILTSFMKSSIVVMTSTFNVQTAGSRSPHPVHAHWSGAQLQELTSCSVAEGNFYIFWFQTTPTTEGCHIWLIMDIYQARNPGCRLRDLTGYDAQVHWTHDLCLHRVETLILSLLNTIHVNYVTLLQTAYYLDHFRAVSILCASLSHPAREMCLKEPRKFFRSFLMNTLLQVCFTR